jgi:hypothetical protein
VVVRAEWRSHEARAETVLRFVCGINSALVSRRHTPSFNSNSGAPPRIWTLLAGLQTRGVRSAGDHASHWGALGVALRAEDIAAIDHHFRR